MLDNLLEEALRYNRKCSLILRKC